MNENTPKPPAPRYFRLLEKGETIKEDDLWMHNHALDAAKLVGLTVDSNTYLRPVVVDEWVSYAERKPTKEDLLPSGNINVVFSDGSFGSHGVHSLNHLEDNKAIWWRLVTPPQNAKPKSATVRLREANGLKDVTNPVIVNADGTVMLSCGDVISSESIEEFLKAREEVMRKD